SVAGTLHLQVVVRSWERTYGATVSTATTNSRRFVRAFGSPGDVLLAVGLAAFALAELSGLPGLPRGVTIPGATLMTIPLLWRRHLPVTVAATVSGAFAAQTLLGVPHNAQLASLVAVLVASYSVGSHAEKRRSLWGLAIIGTSAIVTVPANPGWAVSDFGFAGLVVVGAWLAGRLVRTRTVEART